MIAKATTIDIPNNIHRTNTKGSKDKLGRDNFETSKNTLQPVEEEELLTIEYC
jgi:hypothetical protein